MAGAGRAGSGSNNSQGLLSLRAALVLALSVLVGIGAGALMWLGGAPPAVGVLTGCAAFASAVAFFHHLIS